MEDLETVMCKELKICGLQKTTLLDYPEHLAATVFLGGCNFRCPFCQNGEILEQDSPSLYSSDEILAFLKKRSRILEGVCITGGEPTLQPEPLEAFLRQIRTLGLLIKLDTNGGRPDVVKHLASEKLLDYIAMDIKAGPDHYPEVCGLKSSSVPHPIMKQIQDTLSWLKTAGIPYELRTTAVKGLHTDTDFTQIGPWISGCPRYFIQNYSASDRVLKPEGLQPFTKEELLHFADLVKPYVGQVTLRGIDY